MNIALGSDHRGCKVAKKLAKDLFCRNHYLQDDKYFDQFGDMSGAYLITNATMGERDETRAPEITRIEDSRLDQIKTASQETEPDATASARCVDYPDVAAAVAETVSRGAADYGVLICGTGVGMCITANKFFGVRAAVCMNEVAAELSRRHNNAHILCLSGEFLSPDALESVARKWFATDFDGVKPEGARHQRRLDKLAEIERETGL